VELKFQEIAEAKRIWIPSISGPCSRDLDPICHIVAWGSEIDIVIGIGASSIYKGNLKVVISETLFIEWMVYRRTVFVCEE